MLKNNKSTFKNEAEEDENEELKQLAQLIVEESRRNTPHKYIHQPTHANYTDLKLVESVLFGLNKDDNDSNENTINTRKD